MIFDELIDGEYCDINYLGKKISHKLPKDFDNRYSHEFTIHVYELCRRQLVEYRIDEDNEHILLKITQKGIDIFNENTFHDLASTSFYGYQSYKLSRISLFIAFAAILFSILTIVLTLVIDQTILINESQLKSIKLELQKIDKR